ncbi:hypothetical protein C4D60_Mb08t00600 [Musa balbisiana]|uniref:UBC core domain-containing protein n=1 Tax=Musa balbisiana TaxID=52838 RepID=A0A4S8K0D4_MUSBA|nr:hypothetical protein C4D60_Mb08t00600 [Musa balbisiana]
MESLHLHLGEYSSNYIYHKLALFSHALFNLFRRNTRSESRSRFSSYPPSPHPRPFSPSAFPSILGFLFCFVSAAFLAENSGGRGGCWTCLGFGRSWRSATGTRPSPGGGGSHLSVPVSTPYEGGTFRIDVRLPSTIPFPLFSQQEKKNGESLGVPTMVERILPRHPNISSQHGAICLDIQKDQWSPAFTLKIALLSPQALLSAPEPDDPKDAVVAQQYLRDHPANTIGEQLVALKKRYRQ